MSPNNKKLLQ